MFDSSFSLTNFMLNIDLVYIAIIMILSLYLFFRVFFLCVITFGFLELFGILNALNMWNIL